jgi:hypothetical protein
MRRLQKTAGLRLHITVLSVEFFRRQLRRNDTVRWENENEETTDFSDLGDFDEQRRMQFLRSVLPQQTGRATLCPTGHVPGLSADRGMQSLLGGNGHAWPDRVIRQPILPAREND